MIYIGAEQIISPLGNTASQNFQAAVAGMTGIKNHPNKNNPSGIIENFEVAEGFTRIESLGITAAQNSLARVSDSSLNEKWLFILSTTKGDISYLATGEIENAKPTFLARRILEQIPIQAEIMVVSNACISGLLAVITAHDFISAGKFTHALVLGIDVVSDFTSAGFESFYALSNAPAKPFDANRDGLSLGEAASSVILSSGEEIFNKQPLIFAGGASANDANHISGPSRTGEGLVRAINEALNQSITTNTEIDFVSAHGTGTRYNDDMESIAFTRCGLQNVPLNSFKGYFGHTLGAAGVLELAMTMQSMRNSFVIRTLGCDNTGTTNEILVQLENEKREIRTALKTASGFGGCNAAGVLKLMPETK